MGAEANSAVQRFNEFAEEDGEWKGEGETTAQRPELIPEVGASQS
jgi:hypothetical protein